MQIGSVDEILKCDHSNDSYWATLSCGASYYSEKSVFTFWVCGWNPKVWPFKWKLLSSTFLWGCLLFWKEKVFLSFESVDEILKCDHSNEIYWAVLSFGAVYYALQGGFTFSVCGWDPKVWLSSTFQWCCFLFVSAFYKTVFDSFLSRITEGALKLHFFQFF